MPMRSHGHILAARVHVRALPRMLVDMLARVPIRERVLVHVLVHVLTCARLCTHVHAHAIGHVQLHVQALRRAQRWTSMFVRVPMRARSGVYVRVGLCVEMFVHGLIHVLRSCLYICSGRFLSSP